MSKLILILIFVLSVVCMAQIEVSKYSFIVLVMNDTINDCHDTLEINYNQDSCSIDVSYTFTLSEAAIEFFNFMKEFVKAEYYILPKSEWIVTYTVDDTTFSRNRGRYIR